jgi:hypothetical protein
LEGNIRVLIETLSQDLSGGTEENYEKPQIPGVLTEIQSDHLPNESVNNYCYITLLGPSGGIGR